MWPFDRKSPKSGLPKFVYKTTEGFFEMQCKYGHTALEEGKGVVAIVLDAKKQLGVPVSVKTQPNGNQLAAIKVASDDGGFMTFAETLSGGGDRLKPGDLVVWLPGSYMPQLAEHVGDDRQGWIGLIVAKIAPESDPNTNELTILCNY